MIPGLREIFPAGALPPANSPTHTDEGGYDFRLVLGDGGHSPNHGGVLLPGALRRLRRD